jgi:hypothetical protein
MSARGRAHSLNLCYVHRAYTGIIGWLPAAWWLEDLEDGKRMVCTIYMDGGVSGICHENHMDLRRRFT